MTSITDRLQTLETFIENLNKYKSIESESPPPMTTEDITSLISTQINQSNATLRKEFEPKFKEIENRFGSIDESIKTINSTTSRLDETISRFESTNSQLLQFLQQHHNFPASGQQDRPRANT